MTVEKVREVEGIPVPEGKYSHAVTISGPGFYVWTRGTKAQGEDGMCSHPGNIQLQCQQLFRNLGAILKASGAGFEHVIKRTVYLTDIRHAPIVRKEMGAVMGVSLPASTMVEVSQLDGDGFMIEIETVAWVPTPAGDGGEQA
jgi:2-iminobutanoate/2-iminopropanoate deaminase